MFNKFIGTLFAGIMLTSTAYAHGFKVGDIHIEHPYARPTVAQQTSGGAYLGLENFGKSDDKLLKAETPIAKSVELHNMEMVGDVMKMRAVDQIDLKPGSKVTMKPGHGYHIMLTGLKQQLKAGENFPLNLYFEKAGKVKVMVNVEDAKKE